MNEKYDEKYEHQIKEMAESRIKSGSIKIFDHNARIVKRERISGVESDNEICLVIINREGETIVLTEEFERVLLNVSKARFEE